MLALIITGVVAFLLIPKRPVHFAMLAVACALVLRLAGPGVQAEFMTSFAQVEKRDVSAQSRFDLTRDAIHCMIKYPFFGCGMENWRNECTKYGWPPGKEVHSTWAQTGAELGIPGLAGILAFYLLCCWRLFQLTRDRTGAVDPQFVFLARMVIASFAGFFLAAAAVTVEGVELPYYVMVLGAGTLKLYSLSLPPLPSLDHAMSLDRPLDFVQPALSR
jgi:O-antigen ligase